MLPVDLELITGTAQYWKRWILWKPSICSCAIAHDEDAAAWGFNRPHMLAGGAEADGVSLSEILHRLSAVPRGFTLSSSRFVGW